MGMVGHPLQHEEPSLDRYLTINTFAKINAVTLLLYRGHPGEPDNVPCLTAILADVGQVVAFGDARSRARLLPSGSPVHP